MRPLLPCEGGDARLHAYPPRDALERSRRVALAASVSAILRHHPAARRMVLLPSYQRFHAAETACLRAHQDAERANREGAA